MYDKTHYNQKIKNKKNLKKIKKKKKKTRASLVGRMVENRPAMQKT